MAGDHGDNVDQAEYELELIAIGMAIVSESIRKRLDTEHFVHGSLKQLAMDVKAENEEAVWQAFGSRYEVLKHDGRLREAILEKLKVDAETKQRLDEIAAVVHECMEVYRGGRDKRAFLEECKRRLGND